jgi:hypothetical protein
MDDLALGAPPLTNLLPLDWIWNLIGRASLLGRLHTTVG